jgi:elongation factor G
LSARRGQILGYVEHPGRSGWDDVNALVPQSDLFGFIIELRSQ